MILAMAEQFQAPSGRGRPRYRDIYRRLSVQIEELRGRMGRLPGPALADPFWRSAWIHEAHHSTALEGNTLALREVEKLLEEGRTVGNRELREYLEVKGCADAAQWVYGQAAGAPPAGPLLALADVRMVHHKVMAPVWAAAPHPHTDEFEGAGSYRRHEIRPFPSGMTPVSWPLIDAEMTAWVEEADRLDPSSLDFPEQLAALHCRFEQIHPFLDGNGRTGRLLLNLILVRLGYPPAVIYKRDRERYLQALRRADDGRPAMLGAMLARAVLNGLHRYAAPAADEEDRPAPLAALASPDLKLPALRAAAARGRLKAVRGPDGQWRSSRRWVDEYRAGRWRRS